MKIIVLLLILISFKAYGGQNQEANPFSGRGLEEAMTKSVFFKKETETLTLYNLKEILLYLRLYSESLFTQQPGLEMLVQTLEKKYNYQSDTITILNKPSVLGPLIATDFKHLLMDWFYINPFDSPHPTPYGASTDAALRKRLKAAEAKIQTLSEQLQIMNQKIEMITNHLITHQELLKGKSELQK